LSLIILGLISESLSLTVKVGGNSGSSSITFLPLLTCVLLFGPVPALILHAATGTFGEAIVRRSEPIKGIFNVSQYLLSTVVGGVVFQALGGTPQAGLDSTFALQVGPLVGFGLTFLFINQGAVAIVIAVSERMPLRRVWGLLVGRSGANLGYDLLISPISILMAFLYMVLGIGGFLVIILPLLFIRTAYHRTFQLQEVSANLLKALVKAIDVRDPYTSGHSQRVSTLSRRIAEAMGLSTTQAKYVETAALLHDIGKIDEIYVEILKKEGPLNVLERRVIQSHVTTGVELLESLSSYPEAVLGAVRHHHERVDGGGYPHGLVGNEIPIGARIIKVADAIDAMLSDRPYRKALSVPVVKEELLEFCGTQFDPGVVHAIMSSSVLEDHANEILAAGLNVPETIHGSASTGTYRRRSDVPWRMSSR
jgi:putative nucleotidyltransferase with HDIG domain